MYKRQGLIGPSGMPAPTGVGLQTQAPQQMNPQMADMQINDMLSKNPEVVARIRAAIEAGLQSGELSQQELQMATQLAQVALQNPQMYPQLRQFAIDRGLAGPNDLPMEYDQGLVIALVTAAKAMRLMYRSKVDSQCRNSLQCKRWNLAGWFTAPHMTMAVFV